MLIILTGIARADDDGGVVYLSAYLDGDYFYAPLGNIDGDNVRPLQPRRLNFPGDFRALVELGNHDVSPDGREIVFAARQRRTLDWDIYRGRLDTAEYRVDQLEVLINAPGHREEDPKYSWDSEQIVYKCDGNICLYPDRTGANPVVSSPCELWAPSIDQSGRIISYTKRCGPGDSEKIWYFDLLTQAESRLPETSGARGRFSHYSSSGRLVFS